MEDGEVIEANWLKVNSHSKYTYNDGGDVEHKVTKRYYIYTNDDIPLKVGDARYVWAYTHNNKGRGEVTEIREMGRGVLLMLDSERISSFTTRYAE